MVFSMHGRALPINMLVSQATLKLVKQLAASGASLIAVHARYRGTPTHRRDGPAHLEQVAIIKKAVEVPVLANGNIKTWEDVQADVAGNC